MGTAGNMNKAIGLSFSLIIAGIFIWLWHDAGKMGVLRMGFYRFERSQSQLAFEGLRWLILAMAAVMVAFGVYAVFAPQP
jgi:hypothetical protein